MLNSDREILHKITSSGNKLFCKFIFKTEKLIFKLAKIQISELKRYMFASFIIINNIYIYLRIIILQKKT